MVHYLSPNTLARTVYWFKKAVPKPTSKNLHTQVGVHFEEVGEMLNAIIAKDPETHDLKMRAAYALERLANRLKAGDDLIEVKPKDRIEFLDSLCDQTVTAAGVAHMAGMDIVPALDEVNRSNFSKFDEHGEPIFNADRKIIKGPGYSQPNLDFYV